MHETQRKLDAIATESSSRELLILCSRQLGKSYWATAYAISFCLKNPGKIVRIFAPTLQQVNDIVNDNLEPICEYAPEGLIKRVKSSRRWIVGESELRLGSLERNTVSQHARGGNAALIILEEGGFVSSDDYKHAVTSVIGPQLLRSKGRLIHVTTPSEDMNHYLHVELLPKCEAENAAARFTIYDNPQLDAEAIKMAKELCGGEDTTAFKREYLAEIIRDEISTVVPEFQDDNIVASELPKHAHYQTCIDFGGVTDPHGILLTYYDFERAVLVVVDELFLPKNTATKEIIESTLFLEKQAKWKDKPRRISDTPGQVQVDLNREGFHVRTPDKEPGSWEAGINSIRVAFSRKQIEVHPRCEKLILTLKYGQYTASRKDFRRTEQLGHLDLLMALVYGWRHKNIQNPFPLNEGKSRQTHHIDTAEFHKTKNALNKLLTL